MSANAAAKCSESSEPGSQAATTHNDSARTTNAAASSDATCSDATTLSAFFNLPHELQVRIVELSCRAYKKALRCSSTLGFDDATAIELLCTSRYFNALVTPIFYSHVRVSRPSSLLNLFDAISAHPERGSMIRSLHLGPDDELHSSHWPLLYYDDDVHMNSSLYSYFGSLLRETRINDCSLEPEWYSDVWDVSLTTAEPHCRGKAIYRALKTAKRSLDVDPLSPGRDKRDNNIGLVSASSRPPTQDHPLTVICTFAGLVVRTNLSATCGPRPVPDRHEKLGRPPRPRLRTLARGDNACR